MQSNLRGIIRITLLIVWLTLWGPILVACRLIGGETYLAARRLMYKAGLQIVRIDLVVKGKISEKDPVLFVSNHVSYLDIMVLGSLLPASFISKHEVKSWPLFGLVAVITNTVFIERRASRATQGLSRVKDSLMAKQSLILFPEGTTTNGNHVKEFKSALFQVLEQDLGDIKPTIQTLSIAYTHINGLPMGIKWRPHFAWTGDASLLPHVWAVLKHGGARVEVRLQDPIEVVSTDRKKIAISCQQAIAISLSESLRGTAPLPANVIDLLPRMGKKKQPKLTKRNSA